MVIERDRYLDDSGEWLVTLGLRSRTPAGHSLLTSLTPEEHERMGQALATALDAIAGLLAEKRRAETAAR
jgi:hypothetical protein